MTIVTLNNDQPCLFDQHDDELEEILLDEIKEFFYKNQQLFSKKAGNTTVAHSDVHKLLEKNDALPGFPFGKCFPISQFVFYYLGGYESNYELRCISKIPISIKGISFTTTHWYVFDKIFNRVIDLSKEQFDGIININDYYKKGKKANFGFPYFFKSNKVYQKHACPSKEVLYLYEEFRKTGKKSTTMENYIKQYKVELEQQQQINK